MSAVRSPSDVGRAAWFFLAPALVLIFVCFFLPVLASLVLSVTDFDIYAIANPPTTRFVGLANYSKLLHTPEFWQALRIRSTLPSSADRSPSRSHSARHFS